MKSISILVLLLPITTIQADAGKPVIKSQPQVDITNSMVFDRTYEREMRSEDPRYLDLDTGSFVTTHPKGDLFWAMGESDLRVRAGLNMSAVAVAPEKWDASPEEIMREVTRATAQKQVRLGGNEERRTWFFKTHEGGQGVLKIFPHPKRPGSVLVHHKLLRPRYKFEPLVKTIVPSTGTKQFLSLADDQLHAEKSKTEPIAYLQHDTKEGWFLVVENLHNYHTPPDKGAALWTSMSAEEIAVPAGLAAVPFERTGFYRLRPSELPATVLIPTWGLLQIAEVDLRTPDQPSAIVQYKRIATPGRDAAQEPR